MRIKEQDTCLTLQEHDDDDDDDDDDKQQKKILKTLKVKKGKFPCPHAMKAYGGRRSIPPPIFTLALEAEGRLRSCPCSFILGGEKGRCPIKSGIEYLNFVQSNRI